MTESSILYLSQIKAVDNGRPQKSSTCRLHIEWIPKPEVPADAALLLFEESPFIFSVMESDPVAHMVGVVATESSDVPVWFEITGTASYTCISVVVRVHAFSRNVMCHKSAS